MINYEIKVKFDHEILKTFIKQPQHRDDFLVFDNVIIGGSGDIVVVYRSPFEERMVVSKAEYDAKVLAKQRGEQLDKLI
jgi:hypothetical protein